MSCIVGRDRLSRSRSLAHTMLAGVLLVLLQAGQGACRPTSDQVQQRGNEAATTEGASVGMTWQYHVTVRVAERAGVGSTQFPVSFDLDTATLVAEGKMRADGADIRVTVGGWGAPCQVAGMNSAQTRVTFQLDLKPGETRDDVVLHYGNPAAPAPSYEGGWGTIREGMDGFENELFRVGYGFKVGTFGQQWPCQNEFYVKAYDEDQFGGDAVPESGGKSRNDVTYWNRQKAPRFAEIEADGPVYKRVRFSTATTESMDHGTLTDLTQRVTFYRGCPFIHEEYAGIRGAVVDVVTPGGMPLRTEGERNFNYVAHNFDSDLITWDGIGNDRDTRGGFDANRARAERDPRYRYLPDYTYEGSFIAGVVNVHNGRGIGTCAVAEDVRTSYFVDWSHQRAGYSLWPRKGHITRYLYYVTGGTEEVISRGRLLANPPTATLVEPPEQSLPKAQVPGPWGRVSVGKDADGHWEALLENSRIRVHYQWGIVMTGEGEDREAQPQTYIREFVLKAADESQGHWLDSAAHRTVLTDASVVRDEAQVKTVRLEWETVHGFQGPAVSEVSIFPDQPYLRIDYLQAGFPHICDLGHPGGATKGTYAIYGAEEWQTVRREIDNPELRDHRNEHHQLTDDLFPIYPNPLIDKGWGPTPMDYKGWYALGVYNPENGGGFGRVVPADVMTYMKLLWGRGLEFFPYWRGQWRPYTAYLFAVDGGREEILTLGKSIADRAVSRLGAGDEASGTGPRPTLMQERPEAHRESPQ